MVNSQQGVFYVYRMSDVSRSTSAWPGPPRGTLYISGCAHLITQQQAVWPRCVFPAIWQTNKQTKNAKQGELQTTGPAVIPVDNDGLEYIHGEDKRMITYHLNQLLLLTVIFSATRTPANVQGARDLSKKGKILNIGHTNMDKLCNFTLYFCL